jgi:hypothetical protein
MPTASRERLAVHGGPEVTPNGTACPQAVPSVIEPEASRLVAPAPPAAFPPHVEFPFLGRASLTSIGCPSRAILLSQSMAAFAVLESAISTRAKPFERPVMRSVIRLTELTPPTSPKSADSEASVVA